MIENGNCVSHEVFDQIATPQAQGLYDLPHELVLTLFSILCVCSGWSGTGKESALALAQNCDHFHRLYSTAFIKN
jgi:hypothetical protein